MEEKGDINKMNYLKSLNKKIYLADLVECNALKTDSRIEELMKVLAPSIGSIVNPKRISDTFTLHKVKGITEPTIKKYIGYLEEAFIVSKSERYDVKGRRYISSRTSITIRILD